MIKKLIKKILGSESKSSSGTASKGKSGAGGKSSASRRPRGKRGGDSTSSSKEADEGQPGRRRRRPRKKSTGAGGRESGANKPRRRSTPRAENEGDRPSGEASDRPRRRRRSRGPRKPRSDAPRERTPKRDSEDLADTSEVSDEIKAATEEIQRAQSVEPIAAADIEVPEVSEDNEFVDLGLERRIAAAVEEKGYQQPTPIQSEAIPIVLEGRDVVGSAQTGTGKTAAFALPILQHLKGHGKLRCLVLGPTRELAQQVGEAFEVYGKFTDLRSTIVYGGVGYGPQRDAFERGMDIIVATPGRLLDHLSQRAISLDSVEYLILDEVDRMLDMGFLPDVKRIIQKCPKKRQTLFFSATIPPELEKFTEWCLTNPHTIEIGRRQSVAETVNHAFYPVVESQKFDLLLELMERTQWESVLIFTRTKHGADFVASRLGAKDHKVAAMHSNRSQRERTEALAGFKTGKYEVMVATDVAARGLDIRGVTHVINFDTPLHPEDYVHRIGRTGRAQTEGDAFTLLTEEETKYAAAIERFIGMKIERKKIDNFDYKYSAVFASLEGEPDNVFRSRLFRGSRTKR